MRLNREPTGQTIVQEPRLALGGMAKVEESTGLARTGVTRLAHPDKGTTVPGKPAEAGVMIVDLTPVMTSPHREAWVGAR